MSDTRLTKLVDKLEKAKERAASLKRAGEEAAGRMVHSTLVVSGGAATGVIRGLDMAHIPGTQVQTELAVGTGLVTAGMFGMLGKYSEHAVSLGSGMLAVTAAEQVEKAVRGGKSPMRRAA